MKDFDRFDSLGGIMVESILAGKSLKNFRIKTLTWVEVGQRLVQKSAAQASYRSSQTTAALGQIPHVTGHLCLTS